MSTIKDVSKFTGLSFATISKYLNGGNVLPENKRKIDEAIKELDFTVNAFARGLKTNRSRSVAIIVPEIGNVYASNTIPIIIDELRDNGYSAIILDSRSDRTRENELVKFALSKNIDGLMNMPVCDDGSHLDAVLERNIPVVLLDRMVRNCINKADAVMIENAKAAEEATSYLISKGHDRIGLLAGPGSVSTAMERLSGYITALRENNIPLQNGLIEHTDFSIEQGYKACKELVGRNKDMTAILATNYDTTVGAMMAINEMGMIVPDEISLFGFDDMPFAKANNPQISVIAQPLEEIARSAVRLLLNRMADSTKGPEEILVLKTQMKIRGSVSDISMREIREGE